MSERRDNPSKPKRETTGPGLALALEYHRQGRSERAVQLCREATEREPRDADAWSLLGALQLAAGRVVEASTALSVALELAPRSLRTLVNLAIAQGRSGELDNAAQLLARALQMQPNSLEALYNLGLIRLDQGEHDAAIALLERVHASNPALPARRVLARAHARRGAFLSQRNEELAIEAFELSLALDPGVAGVERALATSLLLAGDLRAGWAALERALALEPAHAASESVCVFYSAFRPESDDEDLFRRAKQYAERHLNERVGLTRRHSNERSPQRRLKIGYVSADFRDHAMRLFIKPVLQYHRREHVEVHCYSNVSQSDRWTTRLRGYSDVWHDVAHLDDDALFEQVVGDEIDVLVDLGMHMLGHRLPLFARKPAPVQMSWLAYPGTTGLSTIDYRITDPFLDPQGASLPYTEQSLRLPHSFWCYDPFEEEPAVNELPAVTNGYVTFGCLNNCLKLNARVLEVFAGVLQSVPNSRLVLLAPSRRARERAASELNQYGIASERLRFQGIQWRSDYLAGYHGIDVALDTFPYNGHTTSLDAYWMGVPVVTLLGNTVVGRAGFSQAHHLGLQELVATDPEQYVETAVRLVADLANLQALRRSLRSRLKASPIMQAERFTQDLEHLYREAWRAYCGRADTP